MVRRILAIPLAVVVAIAVFLCSVFSAPPNTVVGQIYVSFQASTSGIGGGGNTVLHVIETGSTYSYAFYNDVDLQYNGTISYTISDRVYDMYVAVNSASIPNLDFEYLAPYYVSYRNLSATVSLNTLFKYLDTNDTDEPSTSAYTTQDITYLCFKNIPSGIPLRISDYNPAVPGGSSGAYVTYNGYNYPVFTFGFYITDSFNSAGSIIDDYNNGVIDLNHALSELNELIDSNISSSTTTEEKILELLIGQSQIDNLIQSSDNKNLHDIQTSVVPGFKSTVDSYVAGAIDLRSALSTLSSDYSSALSASETPEQGLLVNTSYQLALEDLQIQAESKALDKLNSAITDDQLTEADDYYESEEELIDMFEVAEFESALDFQLWFNTLPPSETIEYKKFFDYLLNDSSIRMFLVVPISLILVRILLGTHLVLSRGGDHSSRSSVLSSDDHYRFFGDDHYRGS